MQPSITLLSPFPPKHSTVLSCRPLSLFSSCTILQLQRLLGFCCDAAMPAEPTALQQALEGDSSSPRGQGPPQRWAGGFAGEGMSRVPQPCAVSARDAAAGQAAGDACSNPFWPPPASCLARCAKPLQKVLFFVFFKSVKPAEVTSTWPAPAVSRMLLRGNSCFRTVLPPCCIHPSARSLLEVGAACTGCTSSAGDVLRGAGSLRSSTRQRRSCFPQGRGCRWE